MLRSFVTVAILDGLLAGLLYLIVMPLLAVVHGWRYVMAVHLVDLLLIAIPVLGMGCRLGMLRQALASLPMVFILRWLNAFYFWRAVVLEWVFGHPLRVFEKGH
jgi:hypothetical protein